MARPFIDRLVAYIQSCGEAEFGRRLVGLPEPQLRELEGLYGGPIPPELREYLQRMGADAGGFELYPDAAGGFDLVLEAYRGAARGAESGPPRAGSILIAKGADLDLALDGRDPPRRPVAVWTGAGFAERWADSLEHHCMQQAWYRYDSRGLAAAPPLVVEDANLFQAAGARAAAAGLRALPFSDDTRILLNGAGVRASVQRLPESRVAVGVAARCLEEAAGIARALAGRA